jgi:hypothetical protein
MSLWVAHDAKGILIEPSNQLPIRAVASMWISSFRLRELARQIELLPNVRPCCAAHAGR